MMGRILFWCLIGLAGWWWWRAQARLGPPDGRAGRTASTAGAPRLAAEAMVDCARCGLHLPESEARVDAAGRRYCCDEHRDAGPHAAR